MEHSCEIVLKLDHWFRRCRLKKKFTNDGRKSHNGHRLLTLRFWLRLDKIRKLATLIFSYLALVDNTKLFVFHFYIRENRNASISFSTHD